LFVKNGGLIHGRIIAEIPRDFNRVRG